MKAVAARKGLYATFMPKPFFGINGSGMHCHQSLWDIKKAKNAFADASDPYGLSPMARSYIAGTLEHARGMIAVLAPLVNSYKRLVTGFEAPVYIGWPHQTIGADPNPRSQGRHSTSIERRCPDPYSNRTCIRLHAARVDGWAQAGAPTRSRRTLPLRAASGEPQESAAAGALR